MGRRVRRRLLAAAGALLLALALAAVVPARAAAVTLTPLRILTVGDSITEHTTSYRTELTRLLQAGGGDPVWSVAALSGSRCTYWAPRLHDLLVTYDPDVVVVLCGTNDDTTTAAARDQLGTAVRSMQETIRLHRGETTPVRSITGQIQLSDPYGAITPSWLPAGEERANGVIRDQLALYSPYWTSLAVADLSVIPGQLPLLPDGMHPSAYGYRLYARLLYDAGAARGWWPATSEAVPCGLYGHPVGAPVPAHVPCPVPEPPLPVSSPKPLPTRRTY